MSECTHENCEHLKESALGFGFDVSWIATVLEKYGQEVLSLVIEAARHGLSIGLVVEMVQRFGPALLELVVDLLNSKAMAAVPTDSETLPGPVVEGVNSALVDVLIEKWLPLIIEKYVPLVVEKYGPQIVQMLLDLFLKSLKK